MKYIFFILFFLNQKLNAEQIVLAVGKSHSVPVKPGSQIHLSNASVAKIREMGDQILLTGKSSGTATLKIGSRASDILVVPEKLYLSFIGLSPLLKKFLGLYIFASPDEISIQGELLRLSDWQEMGDVAKELKSSWTLKAKISTELENRARDFFQKLIFKNRLPQPTLILQPQAQVLLSKDYEDLEKRFEQVLGPYGFTVLKDSKGVSLEPMVEILVQIAELKKSEFQSLGIDWPAQATAAFSDAKKLIVDPMQFSATLKALEGRGLAKILASPRLLCRSGKEAQFLAGGEFPIKIMNFKMNQVEWKKHGIVLNIKPLADVSGRMSLYVNAEVSLIDQSQAVDGIPGLLVNRVESHIDLATAKTVALSGLIKQQWGKSRTGLAGLSHIPILGALFSSEDFREDRTDLVVFLSPKVVLENSIDTSIQMPEGWENHDF